MPTRAKTSAARLLILFSIFAWVSASLAAEAGRRSSAFVATNFFPSVGQYRGTLTNESEQLSVVIRLQSNAVPTATLTGVRTFFVDWGLWQPSAFFALGEVSLYRRGHVVVKFGERGFFRGTISADGQSVAGLLRVRDGGYGVGFNSPPIPQNGDVVYGGPVLGGLTRRMNLTYNPDPLDWFVLFPHNW